MFDLALPNASAQAAYPEQARPRLSWIDKAADMLAAPAARKLRARQVFRTRVVELVHAEEGPFTRLDLDGMRRAAQEIRLALRREGFTELLVARSFALIREAAGRTLGFRHFDSQIMGGWILLNGMIAEMETGEGKTLTATLPACTAALAGVPVHIITVNDYLTGRDAEWMGPVYRALGISVAAVVNGMQPEARRAAYASDVTYCTNKELTFDYLRDRIALGAQSSRVQMRIERLAGGGNRADQLVLRGLFFALVDEADSVLVDEARTPLIISGRSDQAPEREMYETALEVAGRLEPATDYVIDPREHYVRITPAGEERLAEWAPDLPGVFQGKRRRQELVTQALSALKVFESDKHYIVRDEKVQIIDEYTGRILADRSWEQGLHQMVEAKEGVPLTSQQRSVARMTYQRFFRRYLWLAGMTGTAREVAPELWTVYGLPVVAVPTNKPVLRRNLGERVFATQDEKWAAIVTRVAEVVAEGRPVLIGTRSVAASERVSGALTAAGLPHRLLNARQDKEEADVIAAAAGPGRITVATNMAGRGTDIKLGPEVLNAGGLHVIATELHDSGRIDRQLYGRCGRQGDPGTFEAIVSLEDELIRNYGGAIGKRVARSFAQLPDRLREPLLRRTLREAQARAERHHAAIRRELLSADERLGDMLAFSGKGE